MKQIVSNECKANLEIILSFMGIVGGIYGAIVVFHQFGIWIYTDQHQLVLPMVLENKGMLIGSCLAVFLLVNALLLLKDRSAGEPYHWEMFGINSFTFSFPFLLIGCLVSVFSKPLGGIELFVSLIFAVPIVYLLLITSGLVIYRVKKRLQ